MMLTEKRRFEIQEAFGREVDGGVCKDFMNIIDGWIEEFDENGPYFKMSSEEFQLNEFEICEIFDEGWFGCIPCGWTLPNSERSYDAHDDVCNDCYQEEHPDDDY